MDINELENFNMSDAVKFHDRLNPKLFKGQKMIPKIRDHLLHVAQDFITYLGVKDMDIEDITVSGSNAAYSYTDHSDIDLHVKVNLSKLSDDDIYKELFDAKKTIYNDIHDITLRGIPVELYVQDTAQPHVTLGEYSILHNKWNKLPSKKRANFDQVETKVKYDKLGKMLELAYEARDYDKLMKVLDTLKRYRRAGLDTHGEFGPENLAYKALRSQGIVQKLYDLKNELHSEELTIENSLKESVSDDLDYADIIKFMRKSLKHKVMHKLSGNEIVNKLTGDPQYQLDSLQHVYRDHGFKSWDQVWRAMKNDYHRGVDEDWHPNDQPPGPEFKPTMPKGTVRVDVSDVYDWYKLGQNISNLDRVDKSKFGKGPPSTIMAFGSEDEEHKYINALKQLGLDTTDIDPIDPHQPKDMPRQKVDPTYNVNEEEVDEATRRDFLKSLGAVGAATAAGGAEAGKFVNVADRIIKPTRDWEQEKQRLQTRCNNILTQLVGLVNQQRAKQGQKPIRKPYLQVGLDFALASAEGDYKDGVIRMDVTVFYDLSNDTIAAVIGHELGHLLFSDFNKPLSKDPKANWEVEMRADVFGVQLMMAAGYKPERALDQLIDQGSDYGNQRSDTHPTLGQRKKRINDSFKRQIFHLTSALKNFNQNYQYLAKLQQQQSTGLAENASGYIPSNAEKDDPRFKTALTVDVKPDTLKKNAKKLGFKISRAGIPPLLRN